MRILSFLARELGIMVYSRIGRITASALLIFTLFLLGACFNSPPTEPEEPLVTEDPQINEEHYQPSEDPNYESDRALIMETIEVGDVRADYDVRVLRALGIEGIQELSYEGNSSSSTKDIRMIDVAGIEYLLKYTHLEDRKGIGAVYRDIEEDGGITRHILYFGSEKREYLADSWEYYKLYNEPR